MTQHDSASEEYAALGAYLAARPQQQWTVILTFPEIEAIIGKPLPSVARSGRWWIIRESGPDAPQSRAWHDAGFGVASVANPTSASGWVQFERGIHRWQGIAVGSWEVGELPVAERLRQLAMGYLQSAKVLCVRLGENPVELSWPRASVACFCFRHAVELFLKSCILHRKPIDKCDHDISKLQKQFVELYPDPEFHFQTIYDISLDDIEELLGGGLWFEEFERKDDQVYRYLSDRQGRSPKRRHIFAPGAWLSMIERLEGDMARIWDRIRNLDGSAARGPDPGA